jgi:hypothetical protein
LREDAMRHFPLRELGYATGFVVLLAALYVGAYAAILEGDEIRTRWQVNKDGTESPLPIFRFMDDSDALHGFFKPIHIIDVRVRPKRWQHPPKTS